MDREGIKEREDGKRGREAINQGSAIIQGNTVLSTSVGLLMPLLLRYLS